MIDPMLRLKLTPAIRSHSQLEACHIHLTATPKEPGGDFFNVSVGFLASELADLSPEDLVRTFASRLTQELENPSGS